MKNHSEFYKQVRELFPNTDPNLLLRISVLSASGVAPEGKGSEPKNKLATMIYALDDSFFIEGGKLEVERAIEPPAPIKPTIYMLGGTSRKKLETLLPQLRQVVERAITLTTQDFTVLETDRTLAKQKEYLAKGATRTLKSKHLIQPSGFAHAVDLGAWINNAVSWDFDAYFAIVQAMDAAATQLGVAGNVRWGGIWDMVLSDFGGISTSLYAKAIEDYKVRHAGKDFLDGPHFEWVA
jgi:peptidoglycan LD-endopeptidase CwlK